jgi:hypothetical protein
MLARRGKVCKGKGNGHINKGLEENENCCRSFYLQEALVKKFHNVYVFSSHYNIPVVFREMCYLIHQ